MVSKVFIIFILIFMSLTAFAQIPLFNSHSHGEDGDSDSKFSVPLVMGAGNEQIGVVEVWDDGSNVFVGIKIDTETYPDYKMSETHLEISASPISWSPPGTWSYGHSDVDDVQDLYIISLDNVDEEISCGSTLYLMVHAAIYEESSSECSSPSCEEGGSNVGSAYGYKFKGSFNYTLREESGSYEEPSLNISKTGPTTVMVDKIYEYIIIVANVGNTTAVNVTLLDVLPSGVKPENLSSPGSPLGTYYSSNNSIVWSLGDMAPGVTTTIKLRIKVDTTVSVGQEIVNNATVTWKGEGKCCSSSCCESSDSDSSSSSGSHHEERCKESTYSKTAIWISTVVGAPTLDITKSGPIYASPGSVINYTITISNPGPVAANDLVVTDLLPSGVSYVLSNPPATITGSTLTWTKVALNAGGTWQIEVSVRVSDSLANGTKINNTAMITWKDSEGSTYGPKYSTHITRILAEPVITLIKTGPENAGSGDYITFTIKLENPSTTTAYNITIIDYIPNGLTYILSAPTGSYDPSAHTLTWSISSLEPGNSIALNITLKAPSNVTGICDTYINRASAAWYDYFGSRVGSTSSTASVHICEQLILYIDKYGDSIGYLDDELLFYIKVTNGGDSVAYNVVVTDDLPEGLEPINSTYMYTYNTSSRKIIWNLGSIGAGESVTIALYVKVVNIPYDGAIIVNKASLTYEDQVGATYGPITDGHRVTLYDDPYAIVYKSGPLQSSPGSEITYTIRVVNPTQTILIDIGLVDYLPVGVEYVSSNPPGSYDALTHTISWSPFTLNGGGSAIFTVTVKISYNASNYIINIAKVTWYNGFNEDNATTKLRTLNDNPPLVGASLEYQRGPIQPLRHTYVAVIVSLATLAFAVIIIRRIS